MFLQCLQSKRHHHQEHENRRKLLNPQDDFESLSYRLRQFWFPDCACHCRCDNGCLAYPEGSEPRRPSRQWQWRMHKRNPRPRTRGPRCDPSRPLPRTASPRIPPQPRWQSSLDYWWYGKVYSLSMPFKIWKYFGQNIEHLAKIKIMKLKKSRTS